MDNQTTQPIVTQSPPQQPVSQPPISSKSKLKPLLLTLLALVVLVVVGYGVYSWQHKKVSDADTKVTSLQSQISSLQSQVNKLSKSARSTTSSPASSSSTNYLQIKELGIELPLSSTIADLSYTWDSTNSQATVGSAALLKYAETQDPSECGAYEGTIYRLGTISKGSVPTGFTGYYKSYTVGGNAYTLYLPTNGCATSGSSSANNVVNQSGTYETALESALQNAKTL